MIYDFNKDKREDGSRRMNVTILSSGCYYCWKAGKEPGTECEGHVFKVTTVKTPVKKDYPCPPGPIKVTAQVVRSDPPTPRTFPVKTWTPAEEDLRKTMRQGPPTGAPITYAASIIEEYSHVVRGWSSSKLLPRGVANYLADVASKLEDMSQMVIDPQRLQELDS
jgi:hypothetical protein